MLQDKEVVFRDTPAIENGIYCGPSDRELVTLGATLRMHHSGCTVGDPPDTLVVNARGDATTTSDYVERDHSDIDVDRQRR